MMPATMKALWILLAVAAAFLAFDSRNSDPSVRELFALLGVPFFIVLFIVSERALSRAKSSGRITHSRFAIAILAVATVPIVSYFAVHRMLVPSTIRWEFSNPGQTGTYQMVEFRFLADGEWKEGPSVEGHPLTCRFPDLNDDGYPDIQVFKTHSDSNEPVEFIYLPENDGEIYWQGGKNKSGLSAAYGPEKYFSNYP